MLAFVLHSRAFTLSWCAGSKSEAALVLRRPWLCHQVRCISQSCNLENETACFVCYVAHAVAVSSVAQEFGSTAGSTSPLTTSRAAGPHIEFDNLLALFSDKHTSDLYSRQVRV